MFVLAENDFKKSFYMKPCVWSRMENRVFRKIIYFVRKIAPLTWKIFSAFVLPSNHFRRRAKTERKSKERKKERKDSQTCKQRERERDRAIEFEIAPVRSLSSSPPRDGEIVPRTHEPIDPSLILTDPSHSGDPSHFVDSPLSQSVHHVSNSLLDRPTQ